MVSTNEVGTEVAMNPSPVNQEHSTKLTDKTTAKVKVDISTQVEEKELEAELALKTGSSLHLSL